MIEWDASLSIGVEAIDAQHRAIVGLINALETEKDSGDDTAANNSLCFLRKYLNDHFAMEADLMLDRGYPGLEEHREQHEQFVNHVIFFEIEKAFNVASGELLTAVLAFLKEWFFNHIAKEDKALGEFLKAQAESA